MIIDCHTHILPGVDDGSRSVEQSLEMLREEARLGVDTILLTPHFYPEECSPAAFLARRRQAWKRLEECLEPGMPALILGAEVYYFEGIGSAREMADLRVQGTTLFLLEMPMCRWTERMISDVLELNRRPDFQVVLAHIERYLDDQPSKTIGLLLEAGVLLQSNVSFFARWSTRRKAASMLAKGQIHMLGSDCHSMNTRRPNWDQLPAKVKSQYTSRENPLSRCIRAEKSNAAGQAPEKVR